MIVTPNDMFLFNNGEDCFDKFKRDDVVRLNPVNVPILVFTQSQPFNRVLNLADCLYQFTGERMFHGATAMSVLPNDRTYFNYLRVTDDDVKRLYGYKIYNNVKKLTWLSKYRSDITDHKYFHYIAPKSAMEHLLSIKANNEAEFDKVAHIVLAEYKCYKIPQENLYVEIDDSMIHVPKKIVPNIRFEPIPIPF